MSHKKFIAVCSIFLIIGYFYVTVKAAYFMPNHKTVDLTPILIKAQLTDGDYQLIYEQTAIAKPLYEELKTLPNFTEKMQTFQADYLKKKNVKWIYMCAYYL